MPGATSPLVGVSSRVTLPASLSCLESTSDRTQRVNLCVPAGSTQVSVQVIYGHATTLKWEQDS